MQARGEQVHHSSQRLPTLKAIYSELQSGLPYVRGRQSPARGPNPARELRQSGRRWLVSFNVKSDVCATVLPQNAPKDERLFYTSIGFSRTLMALLHSLTLSVSLILDPFVSSPVTLGNFW